MVRQRFSKPRETERGSNGKFVSGCTAGPGRPAGPSLPSELRKAFNLELNQNDLRRLARRFFDLAMKTGSVAAARLCLEYSIGYPVREMIQPYTGEYNPDARYL